MWTQYQLFPKKFKDAIPQMFGRWHYFYENKKGKIGLVRLFNDFYKFDGRPKFCWEACGHLDFKQFKTKRDAEIAIYKVLKEPYLK